MRNFKFLLSGIAALTMSTAAANAGSYSADFVVDAEIITDLTVTSPVGLSFGKMSYVEDSTLYVPAEYNNSNISQGSSAKYFGGAHSGIIRVSSPTSNWTGYANFPSNPGPVPVSVTFPPSVILYDNSNPQAPVACATASEFSAGIYMGQGPMEDNYYDIPFGGTLKFDKEYAGTAEHCSGTGEATVVLTYGDWAE